MFATPGLAACMHAVSGAPAQTPRRKATQSDREKNHAQEHGRIQRKTAGHTYSCARLLSPRSSYLHHVVLFSRSHFLSPSRRRLWVLEMRAWDKASVTGSPHLVRMRVRLYASACECVRGCHEQVCA